MTAKTEKHQWEFRTRFRKNAFGWRSQLPIKRVKEAVKEIKKVAKNNSTLAAEGAVLFLERLVPAIQHVDGSSGGMGSAVFGAMKELAPIIANAEADVEKRQQWLDRLWQTYLEDDMGYLDNLGNLWGEFCGSQLVAAQWASELIDGTRTAFNDSTGAGSYFKGCNACLSSLYACGKYSTILDLLDSKARRVELYKTWGVKALAAMGKVEESLTYAQQISDPYNLVNRESLLALCEVILISAGREEEAYRLYGLKANYRQTYLATYKAIAKKYPGIDKNVILQDLINSTPGEEGKWFTSAREAGRLDIALELAQTKSSCDPLTLLRTADKFSKSNPEFALAIAMASLRWISMGYGYEISNLEILSAYSTAVSAAESINKYEETIEEIAEIVKNLPARNLVSKTLTSILND